MGMDKVRHPQRCARRSNWEMLSWAASMVLATFDRNISPPRVALKPLQASRRVSSAFYILLQRDKPCHSRAHIDRRVITVTVGIRVGRANQDPASRRFLVPLCRRYRRKPLPLGAGDISVSGLQESRHVNSGRSAPRSVSQAASGRCRCSLRWVICGF